MKFFEALTPDINQAITQVINDINNQSTLKKFIESVAPEVYKYKNKYSVMAILYSNLSNDQDDFAMKALQAIAAKYGAKVQRNGLVIKILLKEKENEIQPSNK